MLIPHTHTHTHTQYDYDAAEINELTFREGDVVLGIEFVSEDWWSGTLNGVTGVFPGNYVELVPL